MTTSEEQPTVDPIGRAVGRAVLRARLERGYTQERLAEAIVEAAARDGERIRLTGSAVSRWEHGTFLPSLRYRRFLRQVLDIDVASLIPPERLHPLLDHRSDP